jgi:hypothetical protein
MWDRHGQQPGEHEADLVLGVWFWGGIVEDRRDQVRINRGCGGVGGSRRCMNKIIIGGAVEMRIRGAWGRAESRYISMIITGGEIVGFGNSQHRHVHKASNGTEINGNNSRRRSTAQGGAKGRYIIE